MSESEPITAEQIRLVLTAMDNAIPRVGQRVELWIRGASDLPHRFGNVTEVDENEAYVTNMDDFVGRRPGPMFGQWVNAKAWRPDADDEVFGVRVVANDVTT